MKNAKQILLSLLFIFTSSTLLTSTALAWGDLGHEVVGEIAEQIINKDSKTKSHIRALMGLEPFALSATWPDQVRSDGRFDDFAPYHYTTIFKNSKSRANKDALTILEKYPQILQNKDNSLFTRMIAFRYLVHVVGDVHQPLHVGNEFDRGGNTCQVRWQPLTSTPALFTNLHSVWDTNIVEELALPYKKKTPYIKYYGYKQLAAELMKKYKKLLNQPDSPKINDWIRESEELRKSQIYPDSLPENNRPYCRDSKAKLTEDQVPLLSETYIQKSVPLAEKQLVLAGARLAALLKETFKQETQVPPTESEILTPLKLNNQKSSKY